MGVGGRNFHSRVAIEIVSHLRVLLECSMEGFVVLPMADRSPSADVVLLMVDRKPHDESSRRRVLIALYQVNNWDKGNLDYAAELQQAGRLLAAILKKTPKVKNLDVTSAFVRVHDSPLPVDLDKCGFDYVLHMTPEMAQRAE